MSEGSRADLYKEISRKFVESWNNGIDADLSTYLGQFSPTVEWYDHAFFMRHKGVDSMGPFRTAWLTAIKDFRSDIKSIRLVEDGTVIQCVYNGTMVGPLPGRRASGRTFAANVLIILGIDQQNQIEKVDEYYSATLDEAGDVEMYRLISRPTKRGPEKI